MKMSVKQLWREPLVHFMLIGVALFVLYGLTRDVVNEAPNRIVVSSGQVEQLTANFKRTWMRLPTEKELNALVENHVRDEVFYREALAMGLDQNDPMVKRRMRMKLEFILEDLSAQEVTDEVLAAFLKNNPDKFRHDAQFSFQQVFLSLDKHKDLEADANKLLTRLNAGVDSKSVGDSTLVPYEFNLASQSEVARTFGERFADEVDKLKPGSWKGPIYSEYGAHLIKVSKRVDAYLPELADIRMLVAREYENMQVKKQKELAYKKLREGYQVTIESPVNTKEAKSHSITTAQIGKPE